SWYDGEKINKSRTRVDRLGYFDEVSVETPPVAGTTDQVDVEVKVKEKPTGNIMLGAGFSSAEKFTLSGSVQQQNLFGSGKHVGVQVSTSKSNKVYSLSHTDPYFTVDGVSLGFDVYLRNTDTASLSVGSFGSDSAGAGLRWGLPIGEDDYLNLGLSVDRTKLKTDVNSPLRYQEYVARFGEKSNTLLANVGWQKDARDSLLVTTKGSMQRATVEVSLPGSTATYVRATYQHQHFFPLDRKLTLALNGEIGVAQKYGDKELPFFKNFYAGGIGSVRGFESGSLGPRDLATDEAVGGSKRLIGNVELLFPVPGMGRDNSMRLSGFLDAGNVWGYDTKFSLQSLRYSGGIALSWNSPMGPLKFSYANPFNKKSEDKIQRLQFQMGSVF
ncbi:MAG: outer membrane protein assembly factor BamA, partial [Sulfuritalea sp.]|nr:outer membrane protein assembly factor BamA [Sulfuritalea sp.]